MSPFCIGRCLRVPLIDIIVFSLLLPTFLTILNLERSMGQFSFSEFPLSASGILESQNPILFSHVSWVFASSVSVL